jgi:hypothetical protein
MQILTAQLSMARLSNQSSTSIVVESPRRVRWRWATTTAPLGLIVSASR